MVMVIVEKTNYHTEINYKNLLKHQYPILGDSLLCDKKKRQILQCSIYTVVQLKKKVDTIPEIQTLFKYIAGFDKIFAVQLCNAPRGLVVIATHIIDLTTGREATWRGLIYRENIGWII